MPHYCGGKWWRMGKVSSSKCTWSTKSFLVTLCCHSVGTPPLICSPCFSAPEASTIGHEVRMHPGRVRPSAQRLGTFRSTSSNMDKPGDSRSESLRKLLSIADFGTPHFDDPLPMFPSLPEEVAWHQPSFCRPNRKPLRAMRQCSQYNNCPTDAIGSGNWTPARLSMNSIRRLGMSRPSIPTW